jgi:hypothetical protein
MSEWSARMYGEPCRECGFTWTTEIDAAVGLVVDLPTRLAGIVAAAGATGDERHPDLGWSVTGYTLHVADNLRIFAERMAGITAGARPEVASYDEDDLARVRVYERGNLPAATWSLGRSVADWVEVVRTAPADLVMIHDQRGELDLVEVVRSNVHDAVHHLWDIDRTLAGSTDPPRRGGSPSVEGP